MTVATRARSDTFAGLAQEIRAGVEHVGQEQLVLKLTLFLVLLHGADGGTVQIVIVVLSLLMLLLPLLLAHAFLWWPLVAGLVVVNAQSWYAIDNHKYLIMYWVLACAISMHVADRRGYLSRTARLITALVFGFATFWKLYAGEYLDNSFLYWTFLTDPRLDQLSAFLVQRPVEDLAVMREAVAGVGRLSLMDAELSVMGSRTLGAVTWTLSVLGILVEGTVAAVHMSGSPRLYVARHASLMAFVCLTYFLLPVRGFAFVLGLLGLAQCRADDYAMMLRYLALFAIVQLTVIGWQHFLPTS